MGPRTEERLGRAGLSTIGELAALGDDELRGLVPGRFGEALRRRGRAGRTVTVKLRYADFQTITRGQTVGAALDDAGAIWATASALLARALRERPGALRLLGVGVSSLRSDRQLTLF